MGHLGLDVGLEPVGLLGPAGYNLRSSSRHLPPHVCTLPAPAISPCTPAHSPPCAVDDMVGHPGGGKTFWWRPGVPISGIPPETLPTSSMLWRGAAILFLHRRGRGAGESVAIVDLGIQSGDVRDPLLRCAGPVWTHEVVEVPPIRLDALRAVS